MPAAASTGTRRRLPARRVKASGPWGVWLDARLVAKTMTQKEAFDQLRTKWPELFPWGEHSIDSFRAYIRGKAPDSQQQAAFIELLGGPGPNMAPANSGDTHDAGAISTYIGAINDLLAEQRADRAVIAVLVQQNQTLMEAVGITTPATLRDRIAAMNRLLDSEEPEPRKRSSRQSRDPSTTGGEPPTGRLQTSASPAGRFDSTRT